VLRNLFTWNAQSMQLPLHAGDTRVGIWAGARSLLGRVYIMSLLEMCLTLCLSLGGRALVRIVSIRMAIPLPIGK
jgi:hypothetical protein